LRDAVLLGAAGALIVAGRIRSLREGIAIAAESVDSGAAARALERLIRITNEPVPS
jgi:anthranilate phosphoribosyltransferase